MVLGYMFRPHCCHLQANLYRLSALNMRAICVVYDVKIYMLLMSHNGMASVKYYAPPISSFQNLITPMNLCSYYQQMHFFITHIKC